MKHLFMLITVLAFFILCSCGENKTTESQRIDDKVGTIYKFEFEGHTYLIRNCTASVYAVYGGMCHDENCKCKK